MENPATGFVPPVETWGPRLAERRPGFVKILQPAIKSFEPT